MAVGAFAHDVAVGQKLVGLLVVVLFGLFLHEFAVVVEFAEEVGSQPGMSLGGGAAVHIERDAKLLKRLLDHLVVAVYHVLWSDAFFLGADGDGHAVLVRTSDEHHLLLLQPQVAHVDVGRHIHAGQVSDVYATVGVGKCRRDGGALEFLFHIFLFVLFLLYGAKLR